MPPQRTNKLRAGRPIPQRDPADPHPPHTTVYQHRPEMEKTLPPEAKEMINQRFPEMVRMFQQYDQSTGMLEMYRIVRDVAKAIGWPDTSAYLIRDYVLSLINQAKIKPFPGDSTFQIESTTYDAGQIVETLLSI